MESKDVDRESILVVTVCERKSPMALFWLKFKDQVYFEVFQETNEFPQEEEEPLN
jgi:hypothetical protein